MPDTGSAVRIHVGNEELHGDLVIPAAARALVLFAHGSGSSRHSPRNRYVAGVLQEAGLATLLIDLLTREEESIDLRTAELRFDIDLLAERLEKAIAWLTSTPATQTMAIGLFGASTGAAGALVAASRRPESVRAVVSRGGRPDLAGAALTQVQAPTLLIVGGADGPVISLNREALRHLRAVKRLEIVPHATHLFEEPGALEAVAMLARAWLLEYL
jgi:dienelactone hydrolase